MTFDPLGKILGIKKDKYSHNLSKNELIIDGRCPYCGSLAKYNNSSISEKRRLVEVWCNNKNCEHFGEYNTAEY